jgi:ketol-acid reductoisomerase
MDDYEAFNETVESITGPISETISKKGILAVYESLDAESKEAFEDAYCASYRPALEILAEMYDEVSSGNEIRSVILAGERLKEFPMDTIDNTHMWKIGSAVRAKRDDYKKVINPVTAGVYCAMMMAQIDLLKSKGHVASEIVNESVIEAVDSLNPYMHFKGVSYMVDNCSTTARLGSRKWAPRFDYILSQLAYPAMQEGKGLDKSLIEKFKNNTIHKAIAGCAELRPSVDIALKE